MVNWEQGGWAGSINRWTEREISNHFRENPTLRRSRYSATHRHIRWIFCLRTFGRFAVCYFIVDFALALIESSPLRTAAEKAAEYISPNISTWRNSKELIYELSSYLITAQVGILGVVSLALALITLIAQRDNSSTDIQVYYHESMAFEIFASSLSLLSVLIVQLAWPLQTLIHRLGLGSESSVFEATLLGIHFVWLLINIGAIARFISTTFSFVQQSSRENLRESYTANIVQPRAMRQRLREQLYSLAGGELISGTERNDDQPRALFSSELDSSYIVEIESNFRKPVELYDLRVIWVRWVLRSWATRCMNASSQVSNQDTCNGATQSPLISFPARIDSRLEGKVAWCRRRGGLPLTTLEKFVLRRAFRFKRVKSDA